MQVVARTDAFVARLGEVQGGQQHLLAALLRRPGQWVAVGIDYDRTLDPADPAFMAIAITGGDEHAVDRGVGLHPQHFGRALGLPSRAVGPKQLGQLHPLNPDLLRYEVSFHAAVRHSARQRDLVSAFLNELIEIFGAV